MDVKQLKEEVAQLPNIEHLVTAFEKNCLNHRSKNNIFSSILGALPAEKKKEHADQLTQLKNFTHQIQYGQIVNEKLAALAHNIHDMKIAHLTNDKKKTARLINLYTKDPHMSIKQLIFEVPYLESQISLLKNSYNSILEQLSAQLPLESSVALLNNPHNTALKKLSSVSQKQKKYLSLLGKEFVSVTRAIKEKKKRN